MLGFWHHVFTVALLPTRCYSLLISCFFDCSHFSFFFSDFSLLIHFLVLPRPFFIIGCFPSPYNYHPFSTFSVLPTLHKPLCSTLLVSHFLYSFLLPFSIIIYCCSSFIITSRSLIGRFYLYYARIPFFADLFSCFIRCS